MAHQTDIPSLPTRFTAVGARPQRPAVHEAPPRVLLVTEGTYPHAWGGVSTWCDALVTVLPDVRFHIVAVIAAPDIPPVFDVPDNVEAVSAVPLWGVTDVKEAWRGQDISALHRSRRQADDDAIRNRFIPVFRAFLSGLLSDGPASAPEALADSIHGLYRYLRHHDLRETMRSTQVWEAWTTAAREGYAEASAALSLPELELWELTTGLQWATRWLFPLAAEIPQVDVVHAAMAGVCTMVSVAAKREHGAGFMLTEHGVYLRERYIAEASRQDSYFLKLLGLRFARRMTEITYALADQISPCCDYNGRWERKAGARPDQLQTIYYGVDSDAFNNDTPVSTTPSRVVWVGRINPLKDVETLLRAAAEVLKVRPDVEFLLYGTAPEADADYHARCLALHESLGLGESVKFCGYTADPAKAFLSGDLVVLSSVSEGFPYSTLEAMLCGRPVVATSVGGLPEQIEGAGTIVEPRNPVAMAKAIVDILADPERCAELGQAARERAMNEFGHAKFRGRHRASYLSLSGRHSRWQTVTSDDSPAPVVVVPEQLTAVGFRDEAAQTALIRDVEDRAPVPVDALEVAAVIESIGVTDRLARGRYGASDVFALAERVFSSVTADRVSKGVATRVTTTPVQPARRGKFFDAARHPAWAVVPSIVMLTGTWALASMGHWPADRVLALALGMSAGMLSTNGLALAMGRRASVALSLGKLASARRFFLGCLVAGAVLAAAVTLALSLVPWPPISYLSTDREVFVLASVVLAVIWLTASALSLVSATGAAALAMCIGLGATVGTSAALTPATRHHLAFGAVAGIIATLAVMFWVLNRRASSMARKQAGVERLPSIGYLLVEGLPYFVYGTLSVVLFISVHIVGWVTLNGDRVGVATLELGLFLPLLPAVLAAGRAERILRAFWEHAGSLQRSTSALDRRNFGAELHKRFLHDLRLYIAGLVVNSLLTAVAVEVLLRANVISHVVHYRDVQDVRILYVAGLFAYGLMGIAQFCTMYSLSFLRYRQPLESLSLGIVATIAAAVVLASILGFAYLAAALAVGATVYAADAFRSVKPLLADADHHYFSAV